MEKIPSKISKFSVDGRTTSAKNQTFVQRKFKRLEEEEEKDLLIYYVRQQIIDAALEKCYEKYLEKQCIKFVVHCAHKALIEMLCLNFFMHDPGRPYYQDHPDWAPDSAGDSVVPDTWATNTIEVLPMDENEYADSLLEPEEEVFESSESDVEEESHISEHLTEEESVKFDVVLDIPAMVDQILESTSTTTRQSLQSTTSIFTKTKHVNYSSLPSQLPPNNAKLKDLVIKGESALHLEMKPCEDLSNMQLCVDKLPPIRALTKFKQTETVAKKKKNTKQ